MNTFMVGKSEQIFVDSNYFIALFNEQDSLFKNADRISKELAQWHTPLFISNFIFLEIVTITSMRAGREIAIEAGKYLLSHSQIHVIHIDEELHAASWNIFQGTQPKNISFVDCSIVAAMKSEGIHKLLTFDTADFRKLQNQYHFSFYE